MLKNQHPWIFSFFCRAVVFFLSVIILYKMNSAQYFPQEIDLSTILSGFSFSYSLFLISPSSPPFSCTKRIVNIFEFSEKNYIKRELISTLIDSVHVFIFTVFFIAFTMFLKGFDFTTLL